MKLQISNFSDHDTLHDYRFDLKYCMSSIKMQICIILAKKFRLEGTSIAKFYFQINYKKFLFYETAYFVKYVLQHQLI